MLLKRSFLLLAQRTIALVLGLDRPHQGLKPSVLNLQSKFKVRDDTFVALRYRGAARSAANELVLGHAAPREA